MEKPQSSDYSYQTMFEEMRSQGDSIATIVAKNGQEYNLIRTKVAPIEVEGVGMVSRLGYELNYFIGDKTGVVFANIKVRNNMGNRVEIEYKNSNSSLKGQGLITRGLSKVVEDIFKGKVLDGYPGNRGPLEIGSVGMQIGINNVASQKVATKNGFVYNPTYQSAELFKKDYLVS